MLKKKIKDISFVIPVYNEERNLQKLFTAIKEFIYNNANINVEFILVNDGSKDKSLKLIKKFCKNNKKVFFLSYKNNVGKGFALKKGVLFSKKKWIITIDADLSTDFNQIKEWNKKYFFNFKTAYFGSRKLPNSLIKRKVLRHLMGLILNFFLRIFLSFEIQDTQCGFKMYNSFYAKKLYKNLNIYDFSHDIELVLILKKNNISIKELPIKWVHKNYSKVNIFKDSLIFLYRILFTYRPKHKNFKLDV